MTAGLLNSVVIRPLFLLIIIGFTFQSFYTFNNRINYSVFNPVLAEINATKNSISATHESTYSNITFPQQNHINIVVGAALKRDKAFQPNPAAIMKNGTVTWTNEDSVTHTVTSGNGINDPAMGKEFDSGLMGKSFSFMFSKSGDYSYFCQVHPTMVGKLIVR